MNYFIYASRQSRLCLRKTVLKIVSDLGIGLPESRRTEETAAKYYKTPFRLHILLEETSIVLK